MKKTRMRTLAAGAAVAVLLSPLAACGSADDTSGKGGTSSSSTSSKDAVLTKEDFAEKITQAMLDKKTAHVVMSMEGASGEGDMFYDGKTTALRMTLSEGSEKMTMIFTDGVMYMQAPGIAPAGKWAKIDKDTPMLGQMLSQLGSMGPADQMKMMERGLKDLKKVRETEIDGDKVIEYAVTVDSAAAMKASGVDLPPDAASSMPKELVYTIFLTPDHLMRRMSMSLAGQSVKMDMSDWGQDVDISAPAAKDVVPFKMPGME